MLLFITLLLHVLIHRASAVECGSGDITSSFPQEISVEEGNIETWPREQLVTAYDIYNYGVKFHSTKSCKALGCYMKSIHFYGGFPEAYQNAGILLSSGCRRWPIRLRRRRWVWPS